MGGKRDHGLVNGLGKKSGREREVALWWLEGTGNLTSERTAAAKEVAFPSRRMR